MYAVNSDCVRKRESRPDRVADNAYVSEEIDAARGSRHRQHVPRNPGAQQREQDRSDELHCGHHRERKPVDREVETHVHHGEHRPQPADQQPAIPVEAAEPAPGPPPHHEHRRGAGDPQPGDPERLDAHE